MEASELRDMTADELLRKLEATQKELFNLHLRVAGQRPNTTKIRDLHRDVARVKTVLLEKGVKV